ncbi:MAG: glutamate 5-kinase [Candidatus Pseudobacter hemicellulosilyticus]|uniref:Glutamate 5-kinase n=1 Tax=Candidatus Pseudobacter hemicellulosilyticus TaxID=3121375 RepID=A0AAJ6BHJ9_9BACT|nr:MAG: glutamate 5-kinase [Pseudobacter sp.]
MQQPVLVIKLGTAVITDNKGVISQAIMKKVAAEIAELSARYRIVLVSSGAVGSGKAFIRQYKGTLTERKAAAAVGNPLLIRLYQKHFDKYQIPVAQALCERYHFSNRPQFLQLKETFSTFWDNGILPIVNENDLISNVELKFSDNDELATLMAIGFDAEALIICTSVGGFMDNEKKIIPVVQKIDNTILGYVSTDKSSLGLGGMTSKLTFTRLANGLGIQVNICGLKGDKPFAAALAGKNGTTFLPQPSNLKARQKWLASGSITIGRIVVDKGAAKALLQRRSLLTVGIREVKGKFVAGEVVQLMDEETNIIGVAKVKLGTGAIQENIPVKNVVAAHADDIVIF